MRIVGVVVALGLVAAGCSSERASTVDTTPPSAAPDAAPSDTTGGARGGTVAAATTTPVATTTTLPPGSMGARVPNTNLRFAVPELYTELNPTELGDDFYNSPSFDELAARIGSEPGPFETALRENLDLFFFAPADQSGLIGKISVDVRDETELPDPRELRAELSTLGDVESVEPVDVGGVPTLQTRYVSASPDGEPVFGFAVMVVADGRLVDITATTTTETETNALAKLITTTLRIDD